MRKVACNKVKRFSCDGCMSHAGIREGGRERGRWEEEEGGGGGEGGRGRGLGGGEGWEGGEEGGGGGEGGREEGWEETYLREFRINHATFA